MKTEKPVDIALLKLGASRQVLETETSADCELLARLMVRQARRRIRILSRHLDPPIYDTEPFVEAVKQTVLGRRASRVDILVMNSQPLMRRGHRLVSLAQRLTSYLQIRRPARQHATFNSAYLLVDDAGFIDRGFADRYEGTACFHDPRGCKSLADVFDDMWQAADVDPNLRRLA